MDLFSYDSDIDPAKRKLGHLFVVGNISGTDGPGEDSAYAINLVASLAKREYFARPDSSPKEAFNFTLKKVNDVIEEFFKNKDTRLNIGIFAISGENIFISRLGKFKIMLARDNKTIDILNNISLFSREVVQEKEFSNIISGRIADGDKILAFYPTRSIVAREKSIKESFLKGSADQLAEKMGEIKSAKDDFCCAALHISVAQTREDVSHVASPQPQELRDEMRPQEHFGAVSTDAGSSDPVLAVETDEDKENQKNEPVRVKIAPKKKVYVPDPSTQVPHIIPAEFALGKKEFKFLKTLKRLKPQSMTTSYKAIGMAVAVLLLIGVVVAGKSLIFASAEEKQINLAVKEASADLKLAQTKLSQDDVMGARVLLFASIDKITSYSTAESDKIADVKNSILSTLDTIDQAIEVSPTLVATLPDDVAANYLLQKSEWQKVKDGGYGITGAVDASLYEKNLYVLNASTISKVSDVPSTKSAAGWLNGSLNTNPHHIAVDGKIYILDASGMLTTYYKGSKESETSINLYPSPDTSLLTTTDSPSLYLVHKKLGRIYAIDKGTKTLLKTLKVGNSENINDVALGANTLYLMTADSKIWAVNL